MNFGQSIGFLCFLISLYILWQINQLLLLIFTAIIFAVVLNRSVKFLAQYKLTKNQAIGLIFIFLVAIASIILILIIPPFIEQFQLLIDLLPRVVEKIRELLINLDLNQYKWFNSVPNVTSIFDNSQLITSQFVNNFVKIFSNFLNVTLQIILVITLTILFLLNPQKYRYYFLQLFPSFYRYRIKEILDKTEEAIVNWLGGIIINCIFIGTLSGIGLLALGVKLVLVHALLAGLLNFIPNIGPTMSVIFPIMIALIDSPWKIGPILIWYFIIQNIESYVLTPKLMADKVSLLPAITLLSQVFFAKSFGILGLLLALPLTVVFKIWIEEILFQDILDKWELPKAKNI